MPGTPALALRSDGGDSIDLRLRCDATHGKGLVIQEGGGLILSITNEAA